MAIEKGKKFTADEEGDLIAEIQSLIEEKGLKVELIDKRDAEEIEGYARRRQGGGDLPRSTTMESSGCTRCTICPCMICW